MIYQHLLVAIDLSNDCHRVIERAAALAASCAARLTLLHVIEPVSTTFRGEVPVDARAVHAERLEQARQQLETLCAGHPQLTEENRQLRFGQTGQEAHRLAGELGCDLIVTGSHGRHGLALLFGSTTDELLHGAACDVLAVYLPKP